MSWTLIRHKNGQEIPIKVSVLDAFRSVPKRPKPAEPGPEKPKANSKAQVAPKGQKGTNTTNSQSTSEPEVWTAEDDKVLREMKTSDQSWKSILAALGDGHVSESQAKARWKEIQGRPVNGVAAGGEDDANKKATGEKKKAVNLAKQAEGEGEGKGKGGKKDKKSNLKKNNGTKSVTAEEKALKAVAAKYDEKKWLAVASRHFDRTGQRISPEMAKEICGSK